MYRFLKNQRLSAVISDSWKSIIVATCIVAIASLATVGAPTKPAKAAPFLGCSTDGYIVKDVSGGGGDTDVTAIDMVTGKSSSAGQVAGRQLNAIGYNPKDNHFYAWDLQNQVFVRITNDFSTVTPLTINGYSGPTTNIFSGDVDVDGHYWQFVGSTVYEIDLNTSPNPTFVSPAVSPTAPTGFDGTDWAFMPGTNSLYRAMDEGGIVRIWAFDRTTKTWSFVGNTNISSATDGDMGAVYADPEMNFYMSSHNSGKLFRIDLNDTPPFTAVELEANDPSSNDGARCSLASVPTDFGDAPLTYSTLIENDGPRHNVINFDIFNSIAPLMLGHKIDLEEDGFPGTDASGDDANHEGMPGGPSVDDERGVSHILATPGSSAPLIVPAYVTNTSSQAATLVGWIDLDNDGAFELSERVTANVPNGFTGYQQLTFPAPTAPYSVNTFARFRLFAANDTSTAATNLSPAGPATGGEVEDVLVQVGSYEASKSANPAEGNSVDPGSMVTYTIAIKNTGSNAISSLKIDDDLTDVLDDASVVGTPTVSPSPAGTANVIDNLLEFKGNIGIGDTVTITYAVKIKASGSLGNAMLNNYVLAAHSTSCHPAINDGNATVSNPDCKTNHVVGGLANTGTNIFTLLLVSGSLLAIAGTIGYRLRHAQRFR